MSVAVQERSASQTPRQRGGAPAIVLDGLHLAYDGRDVFRDLDLAVTPGQIYGLIGPSGGGKTTILRAALGLLRPTEGTAYLLGAPALRLPRALRARVGYVPQQFSLYPNLTVGENLDFVAGLYGIAAGLMVEQFSKWLRRLPVERDLMLNVLASELTAQAC